MCTPVSDWQTVLPAWSAHLDRTLTDSTAKSYRNHVHALVSELPAWSPSAITSARLDEWVRSKSWSTSTRAKVLCSLRAFYVFCMDRGWADRSPVAGVAIAHNAPGPQPVKSRAGAWREAITDFLAFLRAGGRSVGTIRMRRWQLTDLSELYTDPWLVTGDDLVTWLSRPDLSAEYRRTLRGSVRMFYAWAVKTGRTDRNPAADLDPIRVPRGLPRPIPLAALQEALSGADDRQRLILLLGACAGLRRAEIAELRFSDLIAGQLLVRGKGGVQRLVPLHPTLRQELDAERARRAMGHHGSGFGGEFLTVDGPIFPSARSPQPLTPYRVGELAAGCLPAGWTLHTLRHRFASQAYAAQRDLRAVQELMGHSKPETTARYAAVPDGAKLAAVAGVGI